MGNDAERAGGDVPRESYLSSSDLEVAFTRLPPGSERPEPPTSVMPPTVLEGAMRGTLPSDWGDAYLAARDEHDGEAEDETKTIPRAPLIAAATSASEATGSDALIPVTQGTLLMGPSTREQAFAMAAALREQKVTEKMSSSVPPSMGRRSAGPAPVVAVAPLSSPPALASAPPPPQPRRAGRALVGMAVAVAVGCTTAAALFHLFA